MAGATFGDVGVSLFVAVAAFGDVGMSLFVAAFRNKCCLLPYPKLMRLQSAKSNLGERAGAR